MISDWPVIKRADVELPTPSEQAKAIWSTLIELTEIRPGSWTLIGGQMVLLHAAENSRTPPRVSLDLDILVNAHLVTPAVPDFVLAVEERGFELQGATPSGIAHRYVRDGVSIDILAPEGLGPRTNTTTTPPGRTVEVPGGTQALTRTELIPIRTGDLFGLVPRPSLLGALIAKAIAVDVDGAPGAQREDFVFLLSLVSDPLDMSGQLTRKDLLRLRSRTELDDRDHLAWSSLEPGVREAARAALRILIA